MKTTTPAPSSDAPTLPALALVKTSVFVRAFARALVFAFIVALVGLAVLPWRQFVGGTGRVIAFNPLDRRINVEAQLSGRVKALHITEGQRVKKGQVIAEIQDNDPHLLENLQTQLDAIRNRRDISRERVQSIGAQIDQQELGKIQAIDAANQRVSAARAEAETALLQYTRTVALAKQGIVSTRELELATLRRDTTAASLKAAEAALNGTRNSFDATIASIRAQQGTARAEIATAERDISAMEVQINRTRRQIIEAPRDGIIFQIAVTDGTYLRPGSPVCVIIPETESRFVELWIDGNDAPLVLTRVEKDGKIISPGSPVRVAFSGWPAVQAIGWPNLAVGTFGGEVIFMDPTDDGTGKFRIVVAEKPDLVERDGVPVEQHWPDRERWLRQGVRANGWVMLNEVPLWFELWRQANGFPPVTTKSSDKSDKAY